MKLDDLAEAMVGSAASLLNAFTSWVSATLALVGVSFTVVNGIRAYLNSSTQELQQSIRGLRQANSIEHELRVQAEARLHELQQDARLSAPAEKDRQRGHDVESTK